MPRKKKQEVSASVSEKDSRKKEENTETEKEILEDIEKGLK